ncbi:MAG: beta-propeller domain-containing protein [Firmicutes bacterium]|nr:beta-propeller domain-containing protein [Bacillota bacterium]
MKKILSILLLVFIVLPMSASPSIAQPSLDNAVVLYVDSNAALSKNEQIQIDTDGNVTPVVENARVLVPARFIAERFGFTVSYTEQLMLVSIVSSDKNISYVIGSNVMTVNGTEQLIDPENYNVAAKTAGGRTLIPVRSFAEAIGKQVFYDEGLIIISDDALDYSLVEDKSIINEIIKKVNVLPVVGTAENLQTLLGQNAYDMRIALFDEAAEMTTGNVATSQKQIQRVQGAGMANAPAHSDTNVQVDGVDEADIVKTDGDYLYHVSGQKLLITKINPISQMSVISVIEKTDEEFYPLEVFIDNDKLIIMARVNKLGRPYIYDSADLSEKSIMPPYIGNSLVQCTVYDIKDRSNPVLERTVEVEGNYLSSRKIDDVVYLVANNYINRFAVQSDFPVMYRENGAEYKIGYDEIRYFPGFSSHQYITLLSINVLFPDSKAEVQTLLGAGENIYVSKDNLYVASQKYDTEGVKTEIYKFKLTDGEITYLKKAMVKGAVLNQFSMDEFDGYFRIATTSYEKTEQNNLYILDDVLSMCGEIEEIAPGERIFSVRFVGEKGYIVTFKQVDPLFVLDLSNPYSPQILGNLKIPGYSDYIHPIDERHLIGFGKDATGEGLYQGMKMALFDVSDFSNPVQKYQEIIGGRGTESELLQNHKALMYAPELELFAFPVTVREVIFENNQYQSAYGQLTFSGAYIYKFDVENGFDLKGKISHITADEMKKLGNYVPSDKTISRIIYSGESLITVSQNKLAAHSVTDIKPQNEITLN